MFPLVSGVVQVINSPTSLPAVCCNNHNPPGPVCGSVELQLTEGCSEPVDVSPHSFDFSEKGN